jgi:hypothetical protein
VYYVTCSFEDHEVPTWQHESDGGERELGEDGDSDSEEEEEEDSWAVVGLSRHSCTGEVCFAGSAVPQEILRKLGRSGGGRVLAQNLIREFRGATQTLRQRKVGLKFAEGKGISESLGMNLKCFTREMAPKIDWMDGVKPQPNFLFSTEHADEIPLDLAQRLNVNVKHLIGVNKAFYSGLSTRSKLKQGTLLRIPDTAGAVVGSEPYERDSDSDSESDDDSGDEWAFQRCKKQGCTQVIGGGGSAVGVTVLTYRVPELTSLSTLSARWLQRVQRTGGVSFMPVCKAESVCVDQMLTAATTARQRYRDQMPAPDWIFGGALKRRGSKMDISKPRSGTPSTRTAVL